MMKQFLAILIVFGLAILMVLSSCNSGKPSQTLKDAAMLWKNSMALKKAELITEVFDTSIIAIYNSNPAVYGKAANNKIWQSQFNDSLDQHPIAIEKIEVSKSGDMGYVFGKWWSIHPVENYYNGGRFVSVWKLTNENWKIILLSVNIQEDVKAELQSKY